MLLTQHIVLEYKKKVHFGLPLDIIFKNINVFQILAKKRKTEKLLTETIKIIIAILQLKSVVNING